MALPGTQRKKFLFTMEKSHWMTGNNNEEI